MRLLDYMKREGLRATASKALGKIDAKRGGKAAETVFLRRDNHGLPSLPIPAGLQIRTIEALDIPEFERFNFFPHINPNAYVPAKRDGAIGCFDQDRLVGYVCYESEKRKAIHGTGDFVLENGEAWVGPCYVDRAYRGRGLNRILVAEAAEALERRGITRLFTSINGANASSLASFQKMGFREFARYSKKYGLQSTLDASSTTDKDLAVQEKIVVSNAGKDTDNG